MKMNVNWKDNKCMNGDAMVAWVVEGWGQRKGGCDCAWVALGFDKNGNTLMLAAGDSLEEAKQGAEVFLGIH